jgi:hypothetical protein
LRAVPLIAGLVIGAAASCATSPRIVGEADPAPLAAALAPAFHPAAPPSFNLALEVVYRGRMGRSSQPAYLLADRPGHARLEIPGPMGSTLLAAEAAEGAVTVLLPGQGRTFRIAPGEAPPADLPVPIPSSFAALWELLAGTLPAGPPPDTLHAFLLSDGGRRLDASRPDGLRIQAHFQGDRLLRLDYVSLSGESLSASFDSHGSPRSLDWSAGEERVEAEVLQ